MNYHDLSLSVAQALLRSHVEGVDRRDSSDDGGTARSPGPFCITISREAGALGHTVAAEVGRRLGWPVYDREILDKIAEELRRRPRELEAVDERPGSWLEDCLSSLLGEYRVSSDLYLRYLIGTVRGLEADGHCVIVGRGANFILPAATTLRLRLVAAFEDRVRTIARQRAMSTREATAWVKTADRQRSGFVKGCFGKDPTDPHHYDLVLNLSRLSIDEAADSILHFLRRFEQRGGLAERARPPVAV